MVYSVHTLYIHVWILPLSAKLVHIELLLTHKLATVNLWLLIAAYEQSLICYRTRCKHSYIPGAYLRKHLLILCPTNACQLPLTKARSGLERQRQTCAVWAKRTEYSIEQIRQSLQRLKIAKIVRMQNLHNFRTIDSVFFRHTFAIQVVNHWPTPIANSLRSGTRHAVRSRARVPRNRPPKKGKTEQLAALKCFHCVTKVSYS